MNKKFKKAFCVYQTNDLTVFKFSKNNRDVVVNPKNSVYQDLLVNGFYHYTPLTVNNEFTLLDGHHRIAYMLDLCEKQGFNPNDSPFNVTFIVDECENDSEFNKIQRINNMSLPWTSSSYFTSLCNSGYEPYLRLADAAKNNLSPISKKQRPLLGLGNSVIVATHGVYTTSSKEFKNGCMPKIDTPFYNFICHYIINRNLLKVKGKTEFIRAITEWMTYYYPRFSTNLQNVFDNAILNYREMCETSTHLKNFKKLVLDNAPSYLKTRTLSQLIRSNSTEMTRLKENVKIQYAPLESNPR